MKDHQIEVEITKEDMESTEFVIASQIVDNLANYVKEKYGEKDPENIATLLVNVTYYSNIISNEMLRIATKKETVQ